MAENRSHPIGPHSHVAIFWPCAWGRGSRKKARRLLAEKLDIAAERAVPLSRPHPNRP